MQTQIKQTQNNSDKRWGMRTGGGVAVAMGTDSFWTGLARLKAEYDITGKALVTFMSNSAAAAMGTDAFWEGLERLRTEHGISGKALVTPTWGVSTS